MRVIHISIYFRVVSLLYIYVWWDILLYTFQMSIEYEGQYFGMLMGRVSRKFLQKIECSNSAS